jgi:hypothetical protein
MSVDTMVGNLAERSAADVLTALAADRRTGVLRIGTTAPHWAALAAGDLVMAGSASGPGIVQTLLSQGVIDAATVAGAGAAAGSHDLHVLPGLVELIGEVKLYPAVREQTVSAVFQMLLPSREDFAFTPSEESPLAKYFRFPVDIIVAEAGHRVAEWAEIARSIASTNTVFRPTRRLEPDVTTISLSREEWAVLAVLDGRRSVAQAIAAVGRSSFDVCSVIHRLSKGGLVERIN